MGAIRLVSTGRGTSTTPQIGATTSAARSAARWIPRLYNGRDKTFFFFNWEEFLESTTISFPLTLPIAAYRRGDFSSISPNGAAGFNPALGVPRGPLPSTDPLGRPIYANTIYNPFSERSAPNGIPVRDPFPGNIIPLGQETRRTLNTPWNMDGDPITLGEFVEYRDPQPQTRTGVA